jgi:hypothetical protein
LAARKGYVGQNLFELYEFANYQTTNGRRRGPGALLTKQKQVKLAVPGPIWRDYLNSCGRRSIGQKVPDHQNSQNEGSDGTVMEICDHTDGAIHPYRNSLFRYNSIDLIWLLYSKGGSSDG